MKRKVKVGQMQLSELCVQVHLHRGEIRHDV